MSKWDEEQALLADAVAAFQTGSIEVERTHDCNGAEEYHNEYHHYTPAAGIHHVESCGCCGERGTDMSHWNYRFVEVVINGEREIGLYEVYYDDEGRPNGRTKDLATFSGATKMEAWDAYSKGGDALGRPVLKDADLSAVKGDSDD